MVDRRTVLKFIGLSPAAIPLASEAASAGMGRSVMAATVARQARSGGIKGYGDDDCSIQDDPVEVSDEDVFAQQSEYIRTLWEEFLFATSAASERDWKRDHDARRLDPDLIENRSLALHARLRIQTDRDWAKFVASRRKDFRGYVDRVVGGKRKRRGHPGEYSTVLTSRLVDFTRRLVEPSPSTPDRVQF